jgi:hypothetical protein
VQPDTDSLATFLVGFVAAEGCFSGTPRGNRFILEVGLGASDREMCEALRCFLGIGHVYDSPRRKPHYDDEFAFHVMALRELIEVVVPFMDAHLPPSYKREQYLAWRERLLDYGNIGPSGCGLASWRGARSRDARTGSAATTCTAGSASDCPSIPSGVARTHP